MTKGNEPEQPVKSMADGQEKRAPFSLTRLTAERPQFLSKRYDWIDGKLEKTTAGALSQGHVEVLHLSAPEALVPLLSELTHAQALMLGVPVDRSASRIVTRQMLSGSTVPAGTIARTGDHFTYADSPGFLFLDHDGLPDGSYLSVNQFLEGLYELAPPLSQTKKIVFLSSSSHIVRTDTEEDLTGKRGFHVYIPVKLASDIPRAGSVLNEKAWIANKGFIVLSKNGNILPRTFFDTSVWQPNRVVFASGAICGDGLEQRRGTPILVNPDGADMLDTVEALAPIDEANLALAEAMRQCARMAKKSEAEAIRATWLKENRHKQMRSLGAVLQHAEATETLVAALEKGRLENDFVLMVRRRDETDFKPRTISEILADSIGFHRAVTLDPLEPDYNRKAVVGMLFLDGRTPTLHSFAHGGATYKLYANHHVICILPGEQHAALKQVVDYMIKDSRFYNYGDTLVTIRDGRMCPLDTFETEYLLSERLRFQKTNKNGELYPCEIPSRMLEQLLRPSVVRQLRPLNGVIDHPTITADGTLLDRPGYYPDQGIFLDFDPEDWSAVKTNLTDSEAAEQLRNAVWCIFREFPFVDGVSRGAVLCGLLTSILRASFETAPIFVSTGPVIAAGKSLVMAVMAAILCGKAPAVLPPIAQGDEQELRKVLTSLVMNGQSYAIFDNIEGYLHSPTLQAFTTSAQWSDRPLATNRMLNGASTRVFVGLTGTNLSFSPDLHRRTIAWGIDPGLEHGAGRDFQFCPLAEGLSKRKQIIIAALSLVMTAVTADLPPAQKSFGSFQSWERIVRKTMRYLEKITDGYFMDPVPQALMSTSVNDDTRALHRLHVGLLVKFGWHHFSARELFEEVSVNGYGDLSDALTEATARSERISSKSIGRYLQRFVDRPVWGVVLRAVKGQKALKYYLEPHSSEGKSQAQLMFELFAESLSISPEIYGQIIEHNSRNFQIEEVELLSKTHPIVARDMLTGEKVNFSEQALKNIVGMKGGVL